MTLYEWALRHSVSMQALVELRAMWGDVDHIDHVENMDLGSEARTASILLLEAARKDIHMYRNNVGVLKDIQGRPVRFGLGNDSKARNSIIKSGDYIGIRKITITPRMVGSIFGQFVSRECKHEGWTFGEDPDREGAQLAWIQLILSCGGDAAFCTGEGTL
jgi:hypothetical protein